MKLFTPEEANEALAVVRPLAERLVAARREVLQRGAELERLRAKTAGNGGGFAFRRVEELERAAAEASRRVSELVDELHELGMQVKDLDRGLVDFPARHPVEGAVVLLCWHLGEDEVAFWHRTEDGFAGRKALPF